MKQTDIAREYRDKYGMDMPTLKLARIMYADNPLIFASVDGARGALRRIEGKYGAFNDKRGKITHPMKEERPKNPYNLPESFAVKREAFRLPKDCKKVLFIPDQHIPYHDIRANTIAIDRGVKEGVDTIIMTGDVIDMHKGSKYQHDPRKRDIMHEFDAAREYLEQLRKVFPVAKIYWLKGNHCYHEDTEVLTRDGFKKFTELKESDELAQFNKDYEISYSKPKALTSRYYFGLMYDIENNYSRQVVTDLHDVVVNGEKKKAKDITNDDVRSVFGFGYSEKRIIYPIKNDMIRLLVNIICDGSIVITAGKNTLRKRIQFKLSKTRKIENLTEILESLKIDYTIRKATMSGVNKLQPYYICIYKKEFVDPIMDLLSGKKQFPGFFKEFNQEQTEIVFDELCKTDGHVRDNSLYLTSVNKSDIDLIQTLFLSNGIRTQVKEHVNKSGFANGKLQYIIKARLSESSQTNKVATLQYSGFVYCAEMPLGTLVTRYKGKVAFSGNCTRYEKLLLEKVHELWKDPYYRLEERLQLNELKIQIFDDKQVIKSGNLNITHGHYIINSPWGSANPAKTVYDKTVTDYVIGHVHKNFEFKKINGDGKLTRCYTMGCLSEIRPDYNPIMSNYMHGYGFQIVDQVTGEYQFENKHIEPNNAYYL